MGKIYLFRHGQTIENQKKIFCGFSETELTIEEQNTEINFPKIDILFSSPLSRCTFYTTEIDFEKIIVSENLKESNFGKWESKSFDEINKEFPEQASEYLKDPLNFQFPEGDSLQDIKNELFKWLIEEKEIMIISHEGIIKFKR